MEKCRYCHTEVQNIDFDSRMSSCRLCLAEYDVQSDRKHAFVLNAYNYAAVERLIALDRRIRDFITPIQDRNELKRLIRERKLIEILLGLPETKAG